RSVQTVLPTRRLDDRTAVGRHFFGISTMCAAYETGIMTSCTSSASTQSPVPERPPSSMDLRFGAASLQLAEPFAISRGVRSAAEVVQIEIEHEGVSGYGEAAPSRRYDESTESALAWLQAVEIGTDPWARDEITAGLPPNQQAARAAVDA